MELLARLAEATSKITFRTKHIAVKYHFFREHLSDEIQVKKVDTTNQLADIFTKVWQLISFTNWHQDLWVGLMEETMEMKMKK